MGMHERWTWISLAHQVLKLRHMTSDTILKGQCLGDPGVHMAHLHLVEILQHGYRQCALAIWDNTVELVLNAATVLFTKGYRPWRDRNGTGICEPQTQKPWRDLHTCQGHR